MNRLRNPRFRFTVVLAAAAAMAAVLIGASQIGARDEGTPAASATADASAKAAPAGAYRRSSPASSSRERRSARPRRR